MGDAHPRAKVDEIKAVYDRLFNSSTRLGKIKDAALGGRLFAPADDGHGVPGRSIAWKLFLIQVEPLQPDLPLSQLPYLDTLQRSRKEFVDLMMEKMRAPDGSYEDGFIIPGTHASPPRINRSTSNLEKNNPLSLHDENPWRDWFAAIELRKTILQDVERTFPDLLYFRDPDVQAQLTNILYLYSVLHPDIGYRQGMHELLAPLYHAVDFDSQLENDSSTNDATLAEFCSRAWASADAWVLFCAVMKGVGRWYEWREPSASITGASPLGSHVQLNVPTRQAEIKAYVAPVVEACQRVQSTYLKNVDPLLWKSMQAAGIEPQIYGIRWLRLLFTREFPLEEAMIMWDGLFACDSSFDLAQWVCVAMLVRIRNQLIPADYTGQLTFLLRYPAPPPPDADNPPTSHPITLLLRQALTLQMSPTPSTGVSVVLENRNLLNIPMDVPEPPPPPVRRRPGHVQRGQSISASEASGSTARQTPILSSATHGRQTSSQQSLGLPETWAKGILDRGESLGINRANILTAVTEFRRNLPELAAQAASFVRTPLSPSQQHDTFPLAVDRPVEERPPWEPRTRFEMEREIVQLKSAQKRCGKALQWVVDALLQDEENSTDSEKVKSIKQKKRDALESLAYVRDILNGNVADIEDDRLVSEEDQRRAKEANKQIGPAMGPAPQATTAVAKHISPPQPAAPLPLPTVEPRSPGGRTMGQHPAFASFPSTVSSSPPRPTRSSLASTNDQLPRGASTPLNSPPVPKSDKNATAFAPWNYTPSGFASASAVVPLPPPASVAPMSPATPSGMRFPTINAAPPADAADRASRRTVSHDPLGAIP
ncbi:RabGAP/TBC [Punctularia strigosozonata HHB-11173 SS5]|uniref:RabGAP/TBC n=1 Tax=Punctularia strigosozonata (strain HHB-11173) TaxID=741275 RepID=UPI0004416A8F|nr:RabGAP/TBC [Punctularia strigosozonata HHB-11173 SS5]EIN08055.1 RabGAP/TBC [Punctularia strigosozonata HHB-11173 SS5]